MMQKKKKKNIGKRKAQDTKMATLLFWTRYGYVRKGHLDIQTR